MYKALLWFLNSKAQPCVWLEKKAQHQKHHHVQLTAAARSSCLFIVCLRF
jgi:hypothetical protein